MTACEVCCRSCGSCWPQGRPLSLYEREALEGRPCPRCAAYTLCCRDATAPAGGPKRPSRTVRRNNAAASPTAF